MIVWLLDVELEKMPKIKIRKFDIYLSNLPMYIVFILNCITAKVANDL